MNVNVNKTHEHVTRVCKRETETDERQEIKYKIKLFVQCVESES